MGLTLPFPSFSCIVVSPVGCIYWMPMNLEFVSRDPFLHGAFLIYKHVTFDCNGN